MTTDVLDAVHNPARLAALQQTELLDTPAGAEFDRLTHLARRLLHAPTAMISLVDAQRLFLKSAAGLPEPWASRREAPLGHTFCPRVVALSAPVLIPDVRADPAAAARPAARELGIRAYAGVPLTTADGHVLGALCVLDAQPRQWQADEVELLQELAAAVLSAIDAHREHSVRRRVEAQLLESEERFRLLFDHSPDAVLICDPHARDVFWPIVACNAAACRMNGYARSELIGQSIALLHPDATAAALRAGFLEALQADGTIAGEAAHRRKDGSHFEIEFSATLITLGGRELVLSVDRDCTQRKEAAEALRASQANLRTVLDSLPIEFWMRDRDERVVLQSALTLALNAADQADGDAGSQTLPERWVAVNRRAYAGELVRTEERSVVDGAEHIFDSIVAPVAQGPNAGAIVGMRLDITKRKQAEAALQLANQDLGQRVAELSALHEIAQALTQWTDVSAALQLVGATLSWLFDRAAISIWSVDRRPDRLRRLAAITLDQTIADDETLALADDPLAQAIIAGARAHVLTAPTPLPPVALPPGATGAPDTASCMLLPLKSRGTIIGLLAASATAPERTFTLADLALAQTIAGTLANAIENARLFEQAQIVAVEEERKRLARELHDSVSQALFLANLNAEVLPQLWQQDAAVGLRALGDLQQLTRSAQAEMRMLLLELRPRALLGTPLHELLQTLAAAIGTKHGLQITLQLQPAPPLPPDVQLALYRIAQETFNNVVKHAHARCITIGLDVAPAVDGHDDRQWSGQLALHIADDGCGFTPPRVPSGGLGLSGMQERAAAIGAALQLSSAPDTGTRVRVTWSGRADTREAP